MGGHGSKGYQPKDQGFKEIAYLDSGSSPYFNWRKLWDRRKKQFPEMRQDKLWQGKAGEPSGKEYLTDDLTERAVSYIQNQKTSEHPFLLYLSHFAVHLPLQAMEDDTKYFESKSTRGWNGHKNAEYAAMIKRLDYSVGKIMQALEKTGLDENTLLVFMSDNGGVDWERKRLTNNDPLKGGKAMLHRAAGVMYPLTPMTFFPRLLKQRVIIRTNTMWTEKVCYPFLTMLIIQLAIIPEIPTYGIIH